MTNPATGPARPELSDPDTTAEQGSFVVTPSRTSQVGALTVRRALPQRTRRTVGPWCFADHLGPATLDSGSGMGIAPHPHIGLQTVTWLIQGEALHRDTLGTEQVIAPGQLNLMTAGHGVAHSEEGTGGNSDLLHGIQLWVAQPDSTRHGRPAFEHHAELPQLALDHATATVLVGRLDGISSPARRDSDHSGVDLDLRPGTTTVPLDPGHEHAVIVLTGEIRLPTTRITPGQLGYLPPGHDELAITTPIPTRAMLLGGTPLPEPLVMWWNYVARTRDEIATAHADWTNRSERFGHVDSALPPIDVPPPPWRRHD